jgi:branched-subunit amino acid aminotransferase/4-amino-4-deoxychorismate lyase
MTELDGQPASAQVLAALGLYNYGHFTSMLVEEGRVRGLTLHLDRLRRDCQALYNAELDVQHVRKLVRQYCGSGATVARVTVFAPDLDLGRPGRSLHPQVLVTARPPMNAPPPPVRLRLISYQRELPTVKHVGLFGTVWHRRQAQLAGFDDVAFVDPSGRISEGTTWNIGFVQDDQVIWPTGDCLQGVTMDLLKQLSDVAWQERDIDAAAAATMQAVLITNAAVGVRTVAAIDGVSYPVDNGVIDTLRAAYLAIPGEEL